MGSHTVKRRQALAWLDQDADDDDSEPLEWDEPGDEEEFDPEPLDEDIWQEFDTGDEPEVDEPPEELWNDGDWE